jgi:all-trans-retinol 13,14-reductase
MSDRKPWDVVLLGSGISSLTAAAFLSKKGLRVCVLEQYTKPGGYLHCFSRFGERFDTGAHYVGGMFPGQTFHTILSYLGVYDPTDFTPLDPDGFDVFHYPDRTVQMPRGYGRTIEALSAHFPSEREAIRRYFELIQNTVQHVPTYIFNDGPSDTMSLHRELATPLTTIVEGLTQNRDLAGVLYSYCSIHGVHPVDTPFGFHAVMCDSIIQGAHGFTRGGDSLVNRFVAAIRSNGGQVHVKKRVTEIETREGVAVAAHTQDGDRIEAKWFISGAHPKQTIALVDRPEIFSPAFRSRLSGMRETIGIFGLYGLYQGAEDFNPLQNQYYFSSSDPERMFTYERPDQKPSTLFICPSVRTARAPGAAIPLNIHAPGLFEWFADWRGSKYGKRPEEYQRAKEIYCGKILEFAAEFVPQLPDRLSKYVSSSPLSNLHFNGSEDGSSYGIYHSIQNTGPRAIGPRTHVPNLFLTGQSTLFPGILASTIAGMLAAGHIIGIRPLLTELRILRGANL